MHGSAPREQIRTVTIHVERKGEEDRFVRVFVTPRLIET